MRSLAGRIVRRLLPWLAGAALLALWGPAEAATLFDDAHAIADAVARIREGIGGPVRALSLTIHGDAITIRAQDPRDHRHVDEWRLAQRHLAFLQWDKLSGPTPVEPDLINPDLEANLFDLDEVDFAAAATLSRAAIERAALEDKAQVTRMAIQRQVAILPTSASVSRPKGSARQSCCGGSRSSTWMARRARSWRT